jgi:DNA polymerase-3 subunit alpha
MTRTGNPYGVLTLEDFTGNGEIALFGKDYINYSKYGKPGMYLFIRATVEPRSKHVDKLDFKIKTMSLLQDEKDKLIRKLSISMPVSELNDTLVEEFSALLKPNDGKTMLYFNIIDDKQRNVSVNMLSKNNGIEVTQKLMDALGGMENVQFKIN